MLQSKTIDNPTRIWLAFIVLCGFILRVTNLGTQSLWVDELYTIQETGPHISWRQMFHYLEVVDQHQHPPLHYILVKLCFYVFPYTATTLRAVSAVIGTLGIAAMFFLGRELWNNRAGLIAAALTAVNYFHLLYSQEGRDYILVFLSATLSFLYLIRTLKNPTVGNSVWYGICTVFFLHSHYFSMFAICAQCIIVPVFFIDASKERRKIYFKRLMVSAGITVLGFMPLIPLLTYTRAIKVFWIEPVKDSFFTDFFIEYFGGSQLLLPILILLLLVYVLKVVKEGYDKTKPLTEQPLTMSFVVLLLWIFVSCFIPYLRSVLVVPMLISRYTIIVLPAYLAALAIGLELIGNAVVKRLVLVVFVVLSMVHIELVVKYYSKVLKEEFREMAEYLIERNPEHYPIAEEQYSWLHSYYFDKLKYKPEWVTGVTEDVVDSVVQLAKDGKPVDAIWLVGVHLKQPLRKEKEEQMKAYYYQAAGKMFWGGWVQFYYAKNPTDSNVKYANFSGNEWTDLWSNNPVSSEPLLLEKGKYDVVISAVGSSMHDEFARIKVVANGQVLTEFASQEYPDIYKTELTVNEAQSAVFQLSLTNDGFDKAAKEDRNAHVYLVRIKKAKE